MAEPLVYFKQEEYHYMGQRDSGFTFRNHEFLQDRNSRFYS